jgi:GNAT superfamily N-acetyltransferase
MTIVRATARDAGPIAELWLHSRKASIPDIPPPVHTDDEVHSFFAEVVVPSKESWVAVDDGRPVGVLVLDHDVVDHLYVHPHHQRRGIGTVLVRHAKRLRPSGLQLWTFQSNVGARRFYEAHGFVAVQTTDGDNEEGAPDVRYEWRPRRRRG